MSKKITYTDGPIGEVKVIRDFLPAPAELAFHEEQVKVTIGLSKDSIDFFKREAKELLSARALDYAARLGLRPSRVSVRDTRSRWGSCSQNGSLSFSWRLIFAPEFVRDYVVAHEVAHLKEMNHSARFWAQVKILSPDVDRARKWLRDHGRSLLRYN